MQVKVAPCAECSQPSADYYSPELDFLDASERSEHLEEILTSLGHDLLRQLNALMLSSNDLSALPAQVHGLSSLHMLFLAGNRLSSLEGIGTLTALRNLNLDDNEVWFCLLKSKERIHAIYYGMCPP